MAIVEILRRRIWIRRQVAMLMVEQHQAQGCSAQEPQDDRAQAAQQTSFCALVRLCHLRSQFSASHVEEDACAYGEEGAPDLGAHIDVIGHHRSNDAGQT